MTQANQANLSKRRRFSGFTLVELLVVIAIVGVLFAVLLPTLQEARKVAYVAVCASNLRQLSIATHSYVPDQRDSALPLTYRFSFGWGVRLTPYLGREHPGLRGNPESNGNNGSLFTQWKVFRCPENKSERRANALYYHYNYGYNGIITSGVLGGGSQASFDAAWLNERKTMQRITYNHSLIAMMADCYIVTIESQFSNLTTTLTSPRQHNQKLNVQFLDGHVELLARGQRTDLTMVNRAGTGWQ